MKTVSAYFYALMAILCFGTTAEAGIVSLAVPPFENLTGEPRIDWIGEGFSRTLTEKLNQVAELSAAPMKARGFFSPGKEIDIHRLAGDGSTLAADLLVLGAVVKGADIDRLDDPLEVTVRLIDPRTTRQIQALEIAGTMRQLFSLEVDLAFQVSALLGVKLSPAEEAALRTPATRSLAAYKETILGTLYLEDGRYDQSIAMFEEAMRHHPGIFYPRAHQLLGQAYLLSGRKKQLLERFKKDAAALSEVYYNLAAAEEYTGDYEKARDNYGLFLKYTDRKTLLWRRNEPGNPIARAVGTVPEAVTAFIPAEEKRQLSTEVLVSGDRFYYGLANGFLLGRAVADGRRTYAYRTVGKPTGRLAVREGVLYAVDNRGQTYALGVLEGAAPSDVSAYLRLAALAERQGKATDADEIYRHIVEEIKPNVPAAWHSLWMIARAGGDTSAAERYWNCYLDAQY